jgi:hypothetical protein
MTPAIQTFHFCSVHNLLFCPALHEWLSFPPVHLEHTLGEALRLTASACPRCTTITNKALRKLFPQLFSSSVPRAAAGF